MRILFLILVSLLTVPMPARAQGDAPAAPRGFTFRPPPAGTSAWFPIVEFGVALRPSFERIWNVGLARPIGERFALGGVVTVTDDSGTTIAVGPVGRVNLTPTVALDIAPELLVQGKRTRYLADERPVPDTWVQSLAKGEAPGFALDASLILGDWGGVFARTTLFPYSEVTRTTFVRVAGPGAGTSWQTQDEEIVERSGVVAAHRFGVRAGSYPGLGLGVLAVLVSAVVYGTIKN